MMVSDVAAVPTLVVVVELVPPTTFPCCQVGMDTAPELVLISVSVAEGAKDVIVTGLEPLIVSVVNAESVNVVIIDADVEVEILLIDKEVD